MSQDANAPPTGGLKSTLKVAVPIVILMSVIFGVTLSSMYTPKQIVEDKPGTTPSSNNEPPLRFFSTTRMWDPPSLEPEYRNFALLAPSRDPGKAGLPFPQYSMQDRIFQGFYEAGPQVRRASFWFENRNPHGVTLELKGVSCTACSGGRMAMIPPQVTRAYLRRTALAALPIGPFNAFGVGLADPAADFEKLDWTTYKFSEHPHAEFKIPAAPTAPDAWAPQWGIFELTFSVSTSPKVPLSAEFVARVDGTDQVGDHKFELYFTPSEACEVSRPTIDAGEFNQLTGDREYTFLVYSATRGPGSEFGDLALPACVVQAPPGTDPGKFVEVAKIDRVPEGRLLDVAQELGKQGKFTKVQAAYRVTVIVHPKIGNARLDIGQMERTVYITTGDAKPQSVHLVAMVRGSVWVANGKSDVILPTFKGRLGITQSVELVTETAGMELAVVEADCKPRHFKYELVKKAARDGQGYYDLNITIPPGRQYGAIENSAIIVVEVKGANPQRIRIPVRGSGEQG